MPDFDWNIPLPLHFGALSDTPLTLSRVLPDDMQRSLYERFIQTRFEKAHGARIQHFMPELFGISDTDGALCAVAGVRLASRGPLFLEHYVDAALQTLISRPDQQPVERHTLVEVGNLAAADTGSARLSIIAITYLLAMGGLEWVAFTGSRGLVNSFHRLGLKPQSLGPADPLRLGEERHAWGSYYQSQPQVHVGNIRAGFDHLRNIGLFNRLGLPTCRTECSHVA
ncbi:thermostable hemolysin [Pseudomonas ovata]|uniref:thermostable hemolysin n=1 Tax=Pseudomonas ovata TaxID=1839709 RepID=UPI000D69F92B|nr:thermostable hemolysin [Pseudomonas ovata]